MRCWSATLVPGRPPRRTCQLRAISWFKGWLVDFERVMAFVLFATVLYLLNILGGGLGPQAIIWSLVFLLAVAFALWLWGRMITYRRPAVTLAAFLIGVGTIAGAGVYALPRGSRPAAAAESGTVAWEGQQRIAQQHIADGKTCCSPYPPRCPTQTNDWWREYPRTAVVEELAS